MTKTSVRVPKISVSEQCGCNMHKLCKWSGCMCGCHVNKKFDGMKSSGVFIKEADGSSTFLEDKVHWRKSKC